MADATTAASSGNFDFGQFQQIFEYLSNKLKEGGALTPEEQKIYDSLVGLGNQGLDLTKTADFNALYTAFNALADEDTKAQFEKLYGTNLVQDPSGVINFTKPGTLVENLMRKGLSVKDGPVMALLAEGLKDYTKNLANNKFLSMTHAYQDMTPIRAQNIQAYTNAGNIASTAIGRRGAAIGPSISGGVAAGSGGDVGGEGVSIDTRGGPDKPGFLDKFGPAILGILGTGALGIGGYLLKDWWDKRGKNPGEDLVNNGPGPLSNTDLNPYTGLALTSPYEMSSQNPDSAMSLYGSTLSNYPAQQTYQQGFYQTQNPDQWWNQPTNYGGGGGFAPVDMGGGGGGGGNQNFYPAPTFNDTSYNDWWNSGDQGGPAASYPPDTWTGGNVTLEGMGPADTYYPDPTTATDWGSAY